MLTAEIEMVEEIARRIAKEEISKAAAIPSTPVKVFAPKPVVEENKPEKSHK